MKYKLDVSTRCVVGICREPSCGSRVLANNRAGALAQLADHRDRAHPDRPNLPRDTLNSGRRRAHA